MRAAAGLQRGAPARGPWTRGPAAPPWLGDRVRWAWCVSITARVTKPSAAVEELDVVEAASVEEARAAFERPPGISWGSQAPSACVPGMGASTDRTPTPGRASWNSHYFFPGLGGPSRVGRAHAARPRRPGRFWGRRSAAGALARDQRGPCRRRPSPPPPSHTRRRAPEGPAGDLGRARWRSPSFAWRLSRSGSVEPPREDGDAVLAAAEGSGRWRATGRPIPLLEPPEPGSVVQGEPLALAVLEHVVGHPVAQGGLGAAEIRRDLVDRLGAGAPGGRPVAESGGYGDLVLPIAPFFSGRCPKGFGRRRTEAANVRNAGPVDMPGWRSPTCPQARRRRPSSRVGNPPTA